MTDKNVRSTISLPPELDQKINERANQLGLSKSAFMNLAVQAGYEAISLAVNPGMKPLFEAQISKEVEDAKKISNK